MVMKARVMRSDGLLFTVIGIIVSLIRIHERKPVGPNV